MKNDCSFIAHFGGLIVHIFIYFIKLILWLTLVHQQ